MSTSSDGRGRSKPLGSRSVSLLTPDKLMQKRAQDRKSQRQTRGRVKSTILELEGRVGSLTEQLQAMKSENASLKSKLNSWAQTQHAESPESSQGNSYRSPKNRTDMVHRNEYSSSRPCEIMNQTFSNNFILESQISTDNPPGLDLLDPSLLTHAGFTFDDIPRAALCAPVWEARPIHLPPSCQLDKIFIDIIESRRMFDPLGGNVLEFSNAKFPSVAALLNPEKHATSLPLTTAIVTHVIYVLTVSTLPEQIAIIYVMCTMLRWQITGSKKDYDALPEWLRPGAAQLVTGHPVWVDVFPWPKARDRICQNFEYHDNWERFKTTANQTISINWPYEPSDTLIAISDTEHIINPVFMTHIRSLENWTLGPAFVEAFPDLAKCVKVGRPRGQQSLLS